MINLIFDLNNIAHRSLFIVGGYGSKQYSFNSQVEIDQLMRKITTDISFIIRLINPSRVIFAQDESSWRKNIKIDENEGYKANRIKSTYINWNNIYSALKEFTGIMETRGMILTKISSAEADDIAALWSQELSVNQHQHVIIVSGDEDIRQLVREYKEDDKISFVTVFNPFMQGKNSSRKLYVSEEFQTWLNQAESIDFMKPSFNIDKEDFRKIITSERTRIEIVDGEMIALRKIFCGDDGDNVPAIYSWLNEKGVEVRITNSKFQKIYEYLIQNIKNKNENNKLYVTDLYENSHIVSDIIQKITKQSLSIDIEKQIERQIKLLVLNPLFFPTSIREKFNEIKSEQLSKSRINYANVNMYNLLGGTRYVRKRNNENESSIFKDIDKIKGSALF